MGRYYYVSFQFLARVLRSVTDDEERLKLAHKAHVTEVRWGRGEWDGIKYK